MKRRTFIKNSGLTVFSISVFGSLNWNGKQFVGDTPTTTDILGPFYRPGAPMRTNLRLPDTKATTLVFKGTIFKEDGRTPIQNALVEIWHCDENQVYDNTSDDYNYRGGQKTKKNGAYAFQTIMPVPYKADPNDEESWRPAHIHMRVSVPDQQDLITQIYFAGGKYNNTDPWAAAPQAVSRILNITKDASNTDEVVFNVVMRKEIPLDQKVYDRVTGLYDTGDDKFVEITQNDDLLFMKRNGHIVAALSYVGNNTFEGGTGNPKATFELLPDGGTKVVIRAGDETHTGTKYLKY